MEIGTDLFEEGALSIDYPENGNDMFLRNVGSLFNGIRSVIFHKTIAVRISNSAFHFLQALAKQRSDVTSDACVVRDQIALALPFYLLLRGV